MHKTRFANPHGLDQPNNFSCCDDILIMCMAAMNNPNFRKIVRTTNYKGTFKYYIGGRV